MADQIHPLRRSGIHGGEERLERAWVGSRACALGLASHNLDRTQRPLMGAGEHGIELIADRLSERGAELGNLGGGPDAAESKAWAHISGPVAERLVEETQQLGVVSVLSESAPLQPRPQFVLDVLLGVVAASWE